MNQERQLAWIHLNLDRNALPCRFNGIPRPLTTSVLFEPRPRPASFFCIRKDPSQDPWSTSRTAIALWSGDAQQHDASD